MGQRKKSLVRFDDYGQLEIIRGTVSHTFPLHMHKSDCLLEITAGTVSLHCSGVTKLHAGDCCLIPRQVPHALVMINKKPYSYRTICLKHPVESLPENEDSFLFRAKNYISHTPPDSFDIDAMAEYLHYSKFHMIHKFKDRCGLSPYQYYTNMRIEKIRQGLLLMQPLSDLALDLGFSHQSHLCNIFKQYMGITPTQYRRHYRSHANAGENVAKR